MRPKRKPSAFVPYRVKSLFHSIDGAPTLQSKFEVLSTNPGVYFLRNILTAGEITHLEKICEKYDSSFQRSFTENDNNEEVLSEYRTSKFIYLSKGQDNIVRGIEAKAANLVGLSSENVEPLQIVAYCDGQKFDTHHDAGTLMDDGSIELVMPRRLITLFLVSLKRKLNLINCLSFPENIFST